MSERSLHEQLLGDVYDRLETAQTLVTFVRYLNIAFVLRDGDDERFEALTYDAAPTVRAVFCRELAGLSWNGPYKFLSTNARATQLGFDPEKFGKYNTAPTRQTLTTAWDDTLPDSTKRTILAVSERLVTTAYENEQTLNLRPPRHVDETNSDLRERHVGTFSNEQIRSHVRHARETVFGAFDSGRAANALYPDSRFNELQALMALCRCGTPQGHSRMETFFGEEYTPHGDTHLRTIKNYSQKQIQAGFEQSIENLLDAVNDLQILQPPVTVAIDTLDTDKPLYY